MAPAQRPAGYVCETAERVSCSEIWTQASWEGQRSPRPFFVRSYIGHVASLPNTCFDSFFLFWIHIRTFFSLLLERGRGRGKHQCKREASISCLPYTPEQGIEPTTFRLCDDSPTTWGTLARAALINSWLTAPSNLWNHLHPWTWSSLPFTHQYYSFWL